MKPTQRLLLAASLLFAVASPPALADGVTYSNDANSSTISASPARPLPASAYVTERTDVASAVRVVTGSSGALTLPEGCLGAKFFLKITAASGSSPTLDVKIQEKDPASGGIVDVPSAAFAQKNSTTATPDSLVVYPGVATTANRSVSNRVPKTYQIAWILGGGTPSFTFTVGTVALP